MSWFVNEFLAKVISATSPDNSVDRVQQVQFLTRVITDFNNSPKRQYMDVADRYYKNEPDIRNAKRMVIGKDLDNNAVLMESKVLANNKLAHNFMKKLTRQKIGYMLGKPFTLTPTEADDEIAKNYFNACKPYLNLEFFKLIKNVGRDSIVKGIGWLFAYYDESGNLRFKRCAPEEIIPFWADSDHTHLNAIVRQYTVEEYEGGDKSEVKYVEYYTQDGTWYYKWDNDGKLVIDDSYPENPSTHFSVKHTVNNEEIVEGMNWARIPFIAFKYDPDEQSLLTRIKSLIDDYDKKTSGVANVIDDFPNSITVVKNYDGASKEEFVQNKNEYRTIFVQGDGDAKALDTKLNVTEIDKHIERLRQDIYEFGQGVNTADKDIRDTSGVALRFIYADLDMDCIDWGQEVQWSLMKVFWFIQQDLIAKKGKDYTSVNYSIVFNTDVIINETETITNCFTSKGVISDKTIAANHPWVIDADKEMEDLLDDQIEELELERDYGNQANTGIGNNGYQNMKSELQKN